MCMGDSSRQEAGQYELQMAQMAQDELDYWKKGGFRDLENSAILDSKKAASDNKMQQARGKSHIATIRGMQLPPVNPNSSQATSALSGIGVASGNLLARASNDANTAQKAESKSGLVDMAKFGRGQQSIGTSGLRQVAGMEFDNTRTNNAISQSAKDFNAELVGTAAGAAAGMSMGGGAKPNDSAMDGFDISKNTMTGSDGMTTDFGQGASPSDWQMGMAKIRTMFG